MRRRTRGGRNIPTLTRRVTRRKNAMNIAKKANEQAKKVIEESEKLQRQIKELHNSRKKEFNLQELVLGIIHLSGDKPIINLDDYLEIEFDPRLISVLDKQATILSAHKQHNQSYINLKRGLLQQTLHHANELSMNTELALRLSALTPLSNRPNGISNEEANLEFQKIKSKTDQNLKLPKQSEQSSTYLFERMKLAIQVAQEMERMVYNKVSSKPAIRTPLSLQDRTILGENDIHLMDFVKSHDPAYSNPIRKMIGLKNLSEKGPDIYAIFQWLLDATDHVWQEAEKSVVEYQKSIPDLQRSILQCTLYRLHCQKAIYNLSIRVPVMRRHKLKSAPISDLGMIRYMRDELTKWEAVERSLLSIITAQSDDLTDVYRKRLERLEIIEWLAKYTPSRGNSFFSKYQDDLKQTHAWLRKGHVAQLVNHHEQEISAAAPKPSTAPAAAPISVRPSPMKKVVPRPSTGWNRSMYNKRVAEQIKGII